jgi:2-polyprenyl-3-methyl-5-hydroxy-6-metoxy-1,4-benzoquinol methylase
MNQKMENENTEGMRICDRQLVEFGAKLPEPFNFSQSVFKEGHVHFGFWPDNLSGLSLEEAQEKMFNLLLSYFPEPPAKVLDVGCGLGVSAAILAEKGYRVTAIAPSEELISYAKKKYGSEKVDYQNAGFLDESEQGFAADIYDVIFFQESLQTLQPVGNVFQKARRRLAPKGKIVFGDEVCLDRSIQNQTAAHHRSDIITALSESGFRISSQQSVRENVLQTCNEVINRFATHFDHVVRQVDSPDTADRLQLYLNGWKSRLQWYTRSQMGYEIFSVQKTDVFVRAYGKGDEQAILPLFRQVFHNPRTTAHWNWKYRDNPYGNFRIATAFTENGDLAAHFSGYPVPFYFGDMKDKVFIAYQGGDTMTNPEFRSSGLGKTSVLGRTAAYFYSKFCDGVVPFFYGFNTGNIRKFGERFLRFEYIQPIPYHVMEVGQGLPVPAGRFVRMIKGLSADRVFTAGIEFDRFFDNVCNAYAILVKRDAAYIKWRYLDCPDNLHHVFAVRRRGKLTGWGIFSIRGNTLIWGDALCDPLYARDMNFLLCHVIEKMGVPVTQIAGWFSPTPEWWNAELTKMGFFVQNEPNNLSPCVILFDPDFSRDLFEKKFYYTMGDSDLF